MHEEQQYLDLVKKVIETGETRGDRTGTGTLSLFAPIPMRFNLKDGFPLLTTKRVPFNAVLQELLWFLKGSTDAKVLSEKGVKIWNANSSRAFLDQAGLTHRQEGDLGPIYGWQWRHFGAEYTDCNGDYSGLGVDQIQQVIHQIKNEPTSRRIILTAWNPKDIPLMALPPCHMFCQFYVGNLQGEKTLSCLLYQRSGDLGLGVPFNIASYALLTVMIASVCGLQPGELVHTLGDAHVYLNHIEPLKQQLERTPRPFPSLNIKRRAESMDEWDAECFELVGYQPHGKIEMKMSV